MSRQLHQLPKTIGRPALVCGNGPSRKTRDVEGLSVCLDAVLIGCNAIHRDLWPDVLVVLDDPMLDEVLSARAHHAIPIVCYEGAVARSTTFDGLHGQNIYEVDGCGAVSVAGAVAYRAAVLMGCSPIYLIGFDGADNQASIYRGTRGYEKREPANTGKVYDWSLLVELRRHHHRETFLVDRSSLLPLGSVTWESLERPCHQAPASP